MRCPTGGRWHDARTPPGVRRVDPIGTVPHARPRACEHFSRCNFVACGCDQRRRGAHPIGVDCLCFARGPRGSGLEQQRDSLGRPDSKAAKPSTGCRGGPRRQPARGVAQSREQPSGKYFVGGRGECSGSHNTHRIAAVSRPEYPAGHRGRHAV